MNEKGFKNILKINPFDMNQNKKYALSNKKHCCYVGTLRKLLFKNYLVSVVALLNDNVGVSQLSRKHPCMLRESTLYILMGISDIVERGGDCEAAWWIGGGGGLVGTKGMCVEPQLYSLAPQPHPLDRFIK